MNAPISPEALARSALIELARAVPAYIAHARATRYMVKRLLRDIWREWRDLAKAGVPDIKIAAE